MDKKIISVVGGTGDLGSLIVQELMKKPNVQLRLLVRPESRNKVKELERKGVQIVEGALGHQDKNALAELCEDSATVVSAIQGGPDMIIAGQTELLLAAKEAGVRRFIPSTFTLNMFKVEPGQIDTVDRRREFAAIADKKRGNVEVVHIMIGAFLDRKVMFEFMNIINTDEQKAYIWGDGEQPVECTTYLDTARYTVEVATDEDSVPKAFAVAGDSLSFREMVHAYEEETGQELEVITVGSMNDLNDRIEELKKGGQKNFFTYLPLMYYRSLLDGSGKLDNLMNDRYPSVTPVTFREYIDQEIV